MGEPIIIKEGLTKGLRIDTHNPRNSEMFTVFQNMKPTQFGAQEYEYLTDGAVGGQALIDTGYLTFAWPFPQLFRGKEKLIAAEDQSIYLPTFDGTDWGNHATGNKLTIKKSLSVGDDFTIPSEAAVGDKPWHFVDFGEVWALVRPNCTIFKGKHRETAGQGTDVYLGQGDADAEYVTMRTGCAYKNARSIIGGLDGDHFWSGDFKHIWRDWAAGMGHGVDFDFAEVGGNWVMWSNVGGGDLLFIFLADYAYNPSGILGSYTEQTSPAEPQLFTSLRDNSMGMMPMPWSGDVEVVKQLGDAVIVYGENGISALIPQSDPMQTFGIKVIFDSTGVSSRLSVGGNHEHHVFVDNFGEAWYIGTDLKPQRLGYIGAFVSYMPFIHYDERERDFYLGTSADSYILTRSGGFCRIGQKISAIITEAGETCAAVAASTFSEHAYAKLTTDIIDMQTRSLKNINSVEIGGEFDASGDLTVGVLFRSDTTGAWTPSTDMPVSNAGIAHVNVTAVEFKIHIQAEDHTDLVDIDYIKINWALADKRDVRGMHS